MIIYDKDKRILFVPENDDAVILEWKDIYQKGFRDGYKEGYDDAYEDNYQSGYTDGYAEGIVACHVDATSITLDIPSVIIDEYESDVIVEPFDADVELVYTSSDPSIATISQSGYITVLEDGEVTFCVEDLRTGLKDCKEVSVEKSVWPYFRVYPEFPVLEMDGSGQNLVIDTNMDIPWCIQVHPEAHGSPHGDTFEGNLTASVTAGTGYTVISLSADDIGCHPSELPAIGIDTHPDGLGQFEYTILLFKDTTIPGDPNAEVIIIHPFQKAWLWDVPVINATILNQPSIYPATGGTYTLAVVSEFGPTSYPTVAYFDRMLGTAVYSSSTVRGTEWTHYFTYTVPANTGSTITNHKSGATQRMSNSPCNTDYEYEDYFLESQEGGATPPAQ